MCEERRWHTNCSQTNRVLEGNGCDCNRETDKEGIRQNGKAMQLTRGMKKSVGGQF